MKTASIVCILFSLIGLYFVGYRYWEKYMYEPYPEMRHNFIGMTRIEVLEWMDKNGRATKYNFILPTDKHWNKIELRAPNDCFYDSIDDILNDKTAMNQDSWGLGGISLRQGTRLYYKLEFKNNKVIKQKDSMLSDW